MILYHGTTTTALPAITEQGLRPRPAVHGLGVWATTSWNLAVHYGHNLFAAVPCVIEFEADGAEVTFTSPGRCLLAGPVPPDRLTVHYRPECSCHPT